MHNALVYPRLHNPKARIIGIYCPDGVLPPPPRVVAGGAAEDKGEEKTEDGGHSDASVKSAGEAANDSVAAKRTAAVNTGSGSKYGHGVGGDTCVCIPSPKGPHFRTLGQADRWNRLWLLPEEALYLLERGSLEIMWPAPSPAPVSEDRSEEDKRVEEGVPMSLQAAYACFIG